MSWTFFLWVDRCDDEVLRWVGYRYTILWTHIYCNMTGCVFPPGGPFPWSQCILRYNILHAPVPVKKHSSFVVSDGQVVALRWDIQRSDVAEWRATSWPVGKHRQWWNVNLHTHTETSAVYLVIYIILLVIVKSQTKIKRLLLTTRKKIYLRSTFLIVCVCMYMCVCVCVGGAVIGNTNTSVGQLQYWHREIEPNKRKKRANYDSEEEILLKWENKLTNFRASFFRCEAMAKISLQTTGGTKQFTYM